MADDDATPKKKSKLKWVILLVLILLLAGGGAAAWFFFLQDKFLPPDGEAQTETVAVAPANPVGTTVPMPVFTTNLADPLGKRFIRLNIEVEVANAQAAQELAAQNARVRDAVLLLLSSKTYADIATTESKLMLKSEITERLNAILGTGKVYQVFITDMVIQ
ncbi:flagellar basal body-associated FliL family protein [Desulfovibrio sp. OttesenSCG-928-G11]|nr:flagellar basal body-associated FliL family protein [Desulfovibrio sp. OttesenSCG-928-G11]